MWTAPPSWEPFLAHPQAWGTHVRFSHSSGILNLAEHHFHLVHAPALLQLLLLVPLMVLDGIF